MPLVGLQGWPCDSFVNIFEDWLGDSLLATFATTALVLIVAAVAYVVLRRAVLPLLARLVRHTGFRWDDVLADRAFQRWLAFLLPALLIHVAIQNIPGLSGFWAEFWDRVTAAIVIFVATLTITTFLMAINNVYETLPVAKDRPIKGYIQVTQIVVYIFGDILVLAVIANQSPWFFLSGMVAIAAVLLLLYRDTIMSFVASMQLTQNDMLRIGDWIEMPQFGVDGTVVEMALSTVKVANWDKTTSTIPTYKLTSESFKNWRSMEEAGRRLIKRAILIDVSSIRFLGDKELEQYSQSRSLIDHIPTKSASVEEASLSGGPGSDATGDLYRPTNLDALHEYLIRYLTSNPNLATDTMPIVVRQRPTQPNGLPLEIYVFSQETRWQQFEAIQDEIIGHALAILPQFDLRAFQEPTDHAVRTLGNLAR